MKGLAFRKKWRSAPESLKKCRPLSERNKEKVILNVKELVEKAGGKTEEPEKWGVRKYAYPVNYKSEGFYVLMNFEAEDTAIVGITNKLNINKNIVRHMIVAR